MGLIHVILDEETNEELFRFKVNDYQIINLINVFHAHIPPHQPLTQPDNTPQKSTIAKAIAKQYPQSTHSTHPGIATL